MNPQNGHDGVKGFVVPDLGEGLEEVTLSCWRVEVGDDVELNQTLCSLETAKAEVEIPSPYAGRIVERCGDVGDVLPVGSVLVRFETEGAEPQSAEPQSAEPQSAEPQRRKPVLVGYGADDAMDTSRRAPRIRPR